RFAQQITTDPGGSALTSGLGGRPSGLDGSTSAHIWAAHIWAYGPLYALSAPKPHPLRVAWIGTFLVIRVLVSLFELQVMSPALTYSRVWRRVLIWLQTLAVTTESTEIAS